MRKLVCLPIGSSGDVLPSYGDLPRPEALSQQAVMALQVWIGDLPLPTHLSHNEVAVAFNYEVGDVGARLRR